MKKILLILCALVCGTLAFAQSYTDNLHVIVNGDDEGVKQGTVTIEYQEGESGVIDFTLHDFSVDVYISGSPFTIPLGDITVYDIYLGEEVDGVASFSCTEDHNVDYSNVDSDYASWITDVTINMTGDLSETKLHANMEITVHIKMLGILDMGDYPVIATFGYDYGEYLVMNSEGNYLGGGLDWGTHATEIGKPQFFSFIEESDGTGTYTLNGHQASSTSIGWDADYTGMYVDGANPLTWELIDAGNGGYYIACDEGYLTGNGFQEAVTIERTSSDAAVWKLVTLEEAIAGMDEATFDKPVDVTPLIPAPEPKRNNWKNSWVATGYNETVVPTNYTFGQDWNPASCAESNGSTNGFDIRQTIPSLPAGFYTLTAEAFYRNDGGTVIPSIYVTTGTCATDADGILTSEHLPLLETEANDMVSAYNEFLEKKHTVSINFEVDEDGTDITVGFESNVEDNDHMWTIFGELSLYYDGTEAPELEGVEGMMNAEVEATMTAAVSAYNDSPSSATYAAAINAIEAATESVAHYATITAALATGEYEAVLATFDEAGQEAFENDFMAAYTNRTLTDETVEDGLAAACKKQITEFCDMSYALKNSGEWVNAINATNFQMCPTLPTAHEIWSQNAWSLGRDVLEKEAIYKQIEDLPEGTYTLSFYAYGGEAADAKTRPLAYATGAEDQEVAYLAELGEAWTDASLYTFICEVGEDGILQFGMKSQGDGNWYVMEEYSLTFGADLYTYDITSLLSNPSFEDVDVDELTADGTRCDTTVGGAWTVTSLEGWDLAAPTHSDNATYAVSDIMSAAATSTDNNFGVPGEPSDETYMLYLRESHENYSGAGSSASVMQSVVLPAGEYKLTVDSKCVASMEAAETVTLVAGDESQALDIHITANGTEDTKTNPFLDAWDTAVLTFSLTETTEVSLGVAIAYDNTKDLSLSVLLDNFQLFSTEEVETVSYDYDVTWALANPSFETDNVVANLTEDETRGSYKVTSLTGWDLTAPTTGYGISDLMTKEAKETDNNFGVPGEPSDGTYMLYLRDAHAEQNENHLDDASVMQTITLPAGDYKLTVDSKCVAQSTAAGTVTLVAGEHSKALTIHVTENGSDDTASNPFLASWDNASLTFSLTAEAEVTVGVNIEFTDGSTNYPLSVLLDNFKLYSVDAIEKEISWTMTDAGWGTMILPFAATLDDGLTAYSCDGTEPSTDDEGNDITVVSLTEVGTSITANTPYIVAGTADTYTFKGTPENEAELYTVGIITGTLVDLAVAKGAALATDGTQYLLQNHDDEGLAFYAILAATEDAENSANATLDAYHCYLDLSLVTTSARPVALHFPGAGEETGIVAVEGAEAEANGAIYDLSGRRVAKAVKGVYIQNGKKVLVK